jgi:hypothetical protein
MGRLWSPHMSVRCSIILLSLTRRCDRLPECGHIFCQTCLQEWFSTTLAHFLATHPNYDANNPMRHIQAFPHLPRYTCPTCRTTVQNRPVEVFALKAIVRTIAAAAGESSPAKAPAVMNHRRAQGVQTIGPWDGFFPRRV